jgi:hypothetical protein
MDRQIDEVDYILKNLDRARQDVIEHPQLFDPNALEDIDKAIASVQETIVSIQEAILAGKAA